MMIHNNIPSVFKNVLTLSSVNQLPNQNSVKVPKGVKATSVKKIIIKVWGPPNVYSLADYFNKKLSAP